MNDTVTEPTADNARVARRPGGRDAKRAARAARTGVTTPVTGAERTVSACSDRAFQAPQAGHWPCHFGEASPHWPQRYASLVLAIPTPRHGC